MNMTLNRALEIAQTGNWTLAWAVAQQDEGLPRGTPFETWREFAVAAIERRAESDHAAITAPVGQVVYDYDGGDWRQFLARLHSGQRCEITESNFDYFLKVLPPVWMGRTVLLDGQPIRASFGFAEGSECVTAFWGEVTGTGRRYFCQRTAERNPIA